MAGEAEVSIASNQAIIERMDEVHPEYQHAYWDSYTSALQASGIDVEKVPFVRFFDG